MNFDPYSDADDEIDEAAMEMEDAELPSSAFLRLPAELRNCIYRHVLLDDGHIRINRHSKPAQPGILQGSKQCRKESADIYYQENAFAFRINNFDAALYISWCRSSERRRSCRTIAKVLRSYNWANLVVWPKACWDRECGDSLGVVDGEAITDRNTALHFFCMAKKLRETGALSWDQAKDVSESADSAILNLGLRWRTGQVDLIGSVE